MDRYRNLGCDSNVVAYEIGANFIKVQFRGGAIYLYTEQSAGTAYISRMQALALAGRGLNGFINTFAKKLYASKQ